MPKQSKTSSGVVITKKMGPRESWLCLAMARLPWATLGWVTNIVMPASVAALTLIMVLWQLRHWFHSLSVARHATNLRREQRISSGPSHKPK